MQRSDKLESELMRIRITLALMTAALVFLGTMLWRIQVVNAEVHRDKGKLQSIRRLASPGARGRIYDRSGICLADNRPSYNMALHIQELRQPGRISNTVNRVESVVKELAVLLQLEQVVTRADIAKHVRFRRPLQFVAWRDVGQEALARWEESEQARIGTDTHLPAVEVMVEPVRVYPMGQLAAHVLGYVGGVKPEQEELEPYHYYYPEMEGKRGVEKSMNDVLAGAVGWKLIKVDASGFKRDHSEIRSSAPGRDITLAMDYRIQRLAEDIISGERGAAVVLDPRNGDVLALASSPTFDSNSFSPRVTHKEWNRLRADPGKPLLHRAVSGMYPPGSTFKPLIAIAALENKKATSATTFRCTGVYRLGKASIRCWRSSGHGTIALQKSIEQSCNSYFCQLGRQCGYDAIFYMGQALGFGYRTGIELNSEQPGLLPNEAWKLKVHDDGWRVGDTCNVSIGQGALLVTPLQMAVFTSTLANGGRVYRPRLVYGEGRGARHAGGPSNSEWRRRPPQGEKVIDLQWHAETMRAVRGGMRDVVQSATGTGKRARVSGIEMAGKTGTAQYGPRGLGKKHTWMLFFGPFDEPRYAGVVMVEDGISGGVTTAPLVHKLMTGILKLEGQG